MSLASGANRTPTTLCVVGSNQLQCTHLIKKVRYTMRNEVFIYNNAPVTFQLGNGDVMVNATEMAKPFSKQPIHWLNNQQSKDYLNELCKLRNLSLADLVTVNKGGNNSGTWLHEDVALEFARWLSPAFAIWCNDRIKELLKMGVTTVSNDDEVIARAMSVLQTRLEDAQRERQRLAAENDYKQHQLEQSAPKVEYYNKVLTSVSTYNANQIAKELGMSAVTLNRKLQQKGVQYIQRGQWLLTAKYQDRGYTKTVIHTFSHSNGTPGTSMLTVFTESGREFIHSLFANN